MTKVKYKWCGYCKKDSAHRVGERIKLGRGRNLKLDYCLVCRKDYPNFGQRKRI